MSQIKIIKQNKNYIALYKPVSWTVYKEAGSDLNCLDFLKKRFHSSFYPVHRLDRATCGVVLFAKSSATASRLTQVIQNRKTRKKYIALTHGIMPLNGKFNNPLSKKGEPLKSALTEYKRKEVLNFDKNDYSFVELTPHTGRFHQLRRHLSMNGFPIVGDPLYEKNKRNNLFSELKEEKRLLLSAVELIFLDPWERKETKIISSLGFESIMKKLKKNHVLK